MPSGGGHAHEIRRSSMRGLELLHPVFPIQKASFLESEKLTPLVQSGEH